MSGNRPYVICHVFSSIDGRIDGPYLFDPAAGPSRVAYARMQNEFGADAIAYGAVTTKGFVGGAVSDLPSADGEVSAGDFAAPHAESAYYISIDPAGEISWPSATFRCPGKPDSHVIELLAEATPSAYRAYLRSRGVSYVVAGKRDLDLALAVRKLGELFGIKRVLVCGGGVADLSFLAAGVLDELSLVVAPVASGERGVATVFDESPFARGGGFAFLLASVERIEGDGVHLTYRRS